MKTRLGEVFRPCFPLVAGILINLAVGVLYAWSVFVEPLEAALDAGRATVSGAQSLCLFMATIGTFVMHRLLRQISLASLALAMGAVVAGGLALAGLGHSVAALYIGYGVLFGFGAGVLYFVAMTAASIKGPVPHSTAISVNMAAIAAGGIAWSPALAALIDAIGAGLALGVAAVILFAAATLGFVLITLSRNKAPPAIGAIGLFEDILTDRPRVVIAIFLGFLCIAFTALSVIGHAATMMASWGAAADQTRFAPMLAGAGYALGALVGGFLTDLLTGKRVLVGVGLVMGAFLLTLHLAPGIALGLATIAAIAVCFGATASAHPVTIARYYGMAAMPRVYGRLALAYGLGGLLGPFLSGAIYDAELRYNTVVILIAALAFLGALSYAGLPRREAGGESAGLTT